jgi:cell division protein FtsB
MATEETHSDEKTELIHSLEKENTMLKDEIERLKSGNSDADKTAFAQFSNIPDWVIR